MPWLAEVLGRYGSALADHAGWAALALIAASGFAWPPARRVWARAPRWVWPVVAVGVAASALCWVWHLRWISDDAFISLRYARNWAEGHGLVFNPGERVEGYTNFLWTALLAGAAGLGLDLPTTAIVLGIASYLGVLWIAGRLVRRMVAPVGVSLAAIALAFCYPFASFATGGLETLFSTLLALAALERAMASRPFVAGLLGIAATMAHPDHAIFYVALGMALAAERPGWRRLVAYAAPAVGVYAPYFAARWMYYGQLLPNTFYAKAAGGSSWNQGFFYLDASIIAGGVWAMLPLCAVGAVMLRRHLAGRYVFIALPLYLVYVAKIGGDFMLGRLLCPVLPIAFVVAEVAARRLLSSGGRAAVALVALASLVCVPTPVLGPEEMSWNLSDERTFYRYSSLRPLVMSGPIARRVDLLQAAFGGLAPPPAYAAFAIGIVGWRTRWRIVDIHGLIDPDVAHQPLTERGRPGHEREASPEHIRALGADVSAAPVWPEPFSRATEIWLEERRFYLARYRPELVARLGGNPKWSHVDFGRYLDDYLPTIATRPAAQVRADLARFDEYYFSQVKDPARREQFVLRLSR